MRAFLWALVNTVQWALIVAWTMVWTTLALLLVAILRRPSLGLAMARRIWAPGVRSIGGTRLRIEGGATLIGAAPCFLACNHQSFGDIPMLFALPVNLRFVAKQELRQVPFLGWYMAAMGMVFVDRERRTRGAAAVVEAVAAVLRAGNCVLSFPAGTRRRPGERQRFKSAAFAAALQARVPVVPVAIHGTGAMLPPHSWGLRPGTVRVRIGEPIPTAGLPLDARDDLARRVEAAVEGMLVGLGAGEVSSPAAETVAAGLA